MFIDTERWLSGWKRLPAKELQEVTFVEGSNPSLSVIIWFQKGSYSSKNAHMTCYEAWLRNN